MGVAASAHRNGQSGFSDVSLQDYVYYCALNVILQHYCVVSWLPETRRSLVAKLLDMYYRSYGMGRKKTRSWSA